MLFTLKTILFVLAFIQSSECYKGVMLFSGLGPSQQMLLIQNEIKTKHPGTDVIIAPADVSLDSGSILGYTGNMWNQVFATYNSQSVRDFMARNPDTFHIVAASQGCILSRGMIEYFGMPVENYISLAATHMGFYGIPQLSSALSNLGLDKLEGISKEDLYLILYTPVIQDTLAVADYWRDPCHYQSYLDNCKFLPLINNEINHPNSARFKKNLIAIAGKMCFFDSPQDGEVIPWQSGHFGSLECNGTITEMMDQPIYKNDSIGLRTLYERNALCHEVVPGLSHIQFATNMTFFDEKVLPLLT